MVPQTRKVHSERKKVIEVKLDTASKCSGSSVHLYHEALITYLLPGVVPSSLSTELLLPSTLIHLTMQSGEIRRG